MKREELLLKTGNETQRMEKIDQLLKFSKLEDEIESLRRQNTLLVQTADNTNLLEQKVAEILNKLFVISIVKQFYLSLEM